MPVKATGPAQVSRIRVPGTGTAVRLRRADPAKPGYTRQRRGKGFSYRDAQGRPLTDPADTARIRDLVIPPAWQDVWISPDPKGHIQATGTDAAGRRQYLYHPAWRVKRDAAKFDHVLEAAARLPRLRRRVTTDLARRGYPRERVLAAAVRLLDHGLFRVGGDAYAVGDDATYGLATLRPDHVEPGRNGEIEFRYPAKGGLERLCVVSDVDTSRVVRGLLDRRAGEERLFAYRDGREWRDVHSDDVNEYLRQASGYDMTAKDFRTWHATVRAAEMLAAEGKASSTTAGRRTVARVMREVAEELGNTPTIARTSYVDPRVVDLYHAGELSSPVDERTVRQLLTG